MARAIRKKSGTGVKTNWHFVWSCSEIDKMITRTDPMILCLIAKSGLATSSDTNDYLGLGAFGIYKLLFLSVTQHFVCSRLQFLLLVCEDEFQCSFVNHMCSLLHAIIQRKIVKRDILHKNMAVEYDILHRSISSERDMLHK